MELKISWDLDRDDWGDLNDSSTYPERQGWGERTIEDWSLLFRDPPQEFVTFLERWLLFGPLCILFGNISTPADFLSVDGILSTQHLLTRIAGEFRCLLRIYDLRARTIKFAAMHFVHDRLLCLRNIVGMADLKLVDLHALGDSKLPLFVFLHEEFSHNVEDPRSPTIRLATSIIFETALFAAFPRPYSTNPISDRSNMNLLVLSTPENPMWAKLRKDGWCPSDISRLASRGRNTAYLYFLYNLERPGIHQTHMAERERSSGSDQLCTDFECAQRKLRPKEYQTKHVDGCDELSCADVVADPKELTRIIRQGNIPLILSVDANSTSSEIILVDAEPEWPYVAISHVWSDGLGNLERNALPRCQLIRLSRMVRNLPGLNSDFLLFWCDTICIPPDSECKSAEMEEIQAMALSKMAIIYSKATKVLVLDSWLFNSAVRGVTDLEILVKIFGCTWNTRLWTYQEGALAKELCFQFSDMTFDLDTGAKEIIESRQDVYSRCNIIEPLQQQYHSLRGFREQQSVATKLAAISRELAYRTTSVATDEPLCIAVLLGLDVEELLRTDAASRMEKLWRMIPSVPWSLIFSLFDCLDVDGLRWAPKTFLLSKSSIDTFKLPRLRRHNKSIQRTEHGVILTSAGIRIPFGKSPIIGYRNLFSREQYGTWHQFESSWAFFIPRQKITCTPLEIWHGVAIIVETLLTLSSDVYRDLRSSGARADLGLLVSVDKEEDNLIHGRAIGTCWVKKVNTIGKSNVTENARFLPETQQWCIK